MSRAQTSAEAVEAVTGVQLMRGIGARRARGFWAEAWSQVIRQPPAIAGLSWVALVAFTAAIAPIVASGHPAAMVTEGTVGAALSEGLGAFLGSISGVWLILATAVWTAAWIAAPKKLPGPASLALGLVVFALFALRVFASFFDPAEDNPISAFARGASAPLVAQALFDLAAALGLVWLAGSFNIPRLYRAWSAPIIPVAAVFAIIARAGAEAGVASPLWTFLRPSDVLILAGALTGLLWILPPHPVSRARRFGHALFAAVISGVTLVLIRIALHLLSGAGWAEDMSREPWFIPAVAVGVPLIVGCLAVFIAPARRWSSRLLLVFIAVALAGWVAQSRSTNPLERFDYIEREAAGQIDTWYTLVPFSPNQSSTSWYNNEPLTTLSEAEPRLADTPVASHTFYLGTDILGQDVLSQMLHASRLAISIGLVSASIAIVIGVTLGALMGYFGGWVDLALFRVVEIFMSIPLLVLLIVAAGVLPPDLRNTYVMMAIIGCFTWTTIARFTRAEFLKLRNQDFVQSARVVGLPLRSILFKHMLPNGITPVLVDASFAIAAAILIEAILSFLGLGPVDQPSWGELLSSARSDTGEFQWWLAIFPGFAIFFTVLSLNLVGEAFRDAIDPKLKKARV